MQIASQEQFRRVIVSLQETANLIAKEMVYSGHLQNKDYLAALTNHRDNLSAAVRAYMPLVVAA